VVPRKGTRVGYGRALFVDAARDIDDEIDAAYRAKYRRYAGSILNSVLTPEARSSTTKIEPRSTSA